MINIRCPYCGSESITENGNKETPAKYECAECSHTFGKKLTDPNLAPEKHCDTFLFKYGGYFEGYHSLTITEQDGYAEMRVAPPLSEIKDTEIKLRITLDEWRSIKQILFYELFVLSWDEDYTDSDILDGTQWELSLGFDDRETVMVSGSNRFPALYDELIWHVKPYFEQVD